MNERTITYSGVDWQCNGDERCVRVTSIFASTSVCFAGTELREANVGPIAWKRHHGSWHIVDSDGVLRIPETLREFRNADAVEAAWVYLCQLRAEERAAAEAARPRDPVPHAYLINRRR